MPTPQILFMSDKYCTLPRQELRIQVRTGSVEFPESRPACDVNDDPAISGRTRAEY
jgi:hypothetical protein